MTEQEVLNLQEQNGNSKFYLMLIGKFFHAYGHGAFALAKATGYRVIRKQRKYGEVLVCGFPIEKLGLVRQSLEEAGASVESIDEKTYLFRGIDGTPESSMVSEPAARPEPQPLVTRLDWLEKAVRSFNLSMSTPMDAMVFIGSLQQRLKETECYNDDACESPAGHGLQE